MTILHWIWPPTRCQNCHSIYSAPNAEGVPNLQHIHRSTDGRFVLAGVDDIDGIMVESKRNSIGSQYSSSDDGGFLMRVGPRTSWRRPLVTCPSQLSFRSEHSGGFFGGFNFGRNLIRTMPQIHEMHQSRPITENLHINTVSANVPGPMISSSLYTPSRVSRVHASSPATSSPLAVNSPWSPLYFSDLSSVHPSSAERSFPQGQQRAQSLFTPNSTHQRSFRTARYINELPSLRTLHDETRRMTQGFIPVQIPSPPMRSYYANVGPHIYQHQTQQGYRPRARLWPRSNRLRTVPLDLSSPMLNMNPSFHLLEQSPESHSSSSGFGSKNTSSHQNQSSQSGGTNDWRYLPPYRAPPPAPQTLSKSSSAQGQHHHHHYHHGPNSPSSPYNMGHWLELITRLNAAAMPDGSGPKAVDVGSVDGHYEFDPATPTPTASTPTGRDESTAVAVIEQPSQHRKRSRFEIDDRVQKMKEEFYAFRKRQAIKRAGIVLESAC